MNIQQKGIQWVLSDETSFLYYLQATSGIVDKWKFKQKKNVTFKKKKDSLKSRAGKSDLLENIPKDMLEHPVGRGV